MRFDDLFDDLAAQAAAIADRQLWDEAAEMGRAEATGLTLLQRLGQGSSVRLWLAGDHVVDGSVVRVGQDFLAIGTTASTWLIPQTSFARCRPAGRLRPSMTEKVTWRRLLRGLARDRSGVEALLRDGSGLRARLVGLGKDHLQLVDEGEHVLIALSAVAAVIVT